MARRPRRAREQAGEVRSLGQLSDRSGAISGQSDDDEPVEGVNLRGVIWRWQVRRRRER